MKHPVRSALAGLLVPAALLAGCSGKGNDAKKGSGRADVKYPVEVAEVTPRRVEYTVSAVGSVEAFEKVQVTARVAGVVEKVVFAEGDVVESGAVLVEIEPQRYQIAVDSARAALRKAEAAKAEAEASLERRQGVVAKSPGLIPGEEIETWRTRASTAAADVAAARAALDQAELNLRDAFVKAPVPGRIQTRTVQTGQYVQPGGVLATLVRRDPLLLRFQVPETEAGRLRLGQEARFTVGGEPKPFTARLTHVADSADLTTRMVAVTATVDDPRRATLRPGAFADVAVPVGATANAPVIPQTAIRPSERGFLAFVVSGDKAQERVLTLGLRTADGLVEVRSGLSPGERLVVRGGEALRDGVTVVTGAKVPGGGARPGGKGTAP